jgi:hypothetical protein
MNQPLPQLLQSVADGVFGFLSTWGIALLLIIAWIAWWLWGANWKNIWPALAQGAWVPAVLVILVSALVWSQIAPGDCTCLGFMTIPNFWWQLGEVSMLAALALFCGWLQGYFEWTPAPVEFEPAHGHHDHRHGHEHGHHDHGHEASHGHDHGSHDHGHH